QRWGRRHSSHAEEQHSHGEGCEPSARQRIAARDERIAKTCNEAERPVSEEAPYDGRAELMETDDRAEAPELERSGQAAVGEQDERRDCESVRPRRRPEVTPADDLPDDEDAGCGNR